MGCGASRLDENGLVIPVKARPLLFLRFEEFKRRRNPHTSDSKDSSHYSKKELLSDDHQMGDHQESNNFKVSSKSLAKDKDNGKESSLLTDDTGSCVTSEEDSKAGGSPDRVDSNHDDQKANGEVKKSLGEGVKGKEHEHNRMTSNETNTKVEDCNIDGDKKIKDDDEDEEEDEDDDYDYDGRRFGHQDGDDLAFPGSPSFRVFFTDNKSCDNKSEDTDDEFVEQAPMEKDDAKPQKPPANQEVKKKQKKRRSFKRVLPSGKQAKSLFNVRACMSSAHHHHQSNPDRCHLLDGKAHA